MKNMSFRISLIALCATLLLAGCDGGADQTTSSDSPASAPPSGTGPYQLTVNVSGSGTVSSSPAGINNCAGSCNASYPGGTVVALTVVPTSGYVFGGWGGGICSGTGACSVSGASTVTATFVQQVTIPAGGPMLFFSDLAAGPRTGNSDTTHGTGNGAIVTVWGKNLGNSQGTSTLSIGGVVVPATAIYYWGPAANRGGGADLNTRMGMQMIEFAIPAPYSGGTVPSGNANIVATVKDATSNDVTSNALTFTTRDQGAIRFVSNSGANSGAGTWSAPWQTIQYATDHAGAGDVIYVLNGVNVPNGFTIGNDGAPAMHKALVAYPGATVTLGAPRTSTTATAGQPGYGAPGIQLWNGTTQDRSKYWTIAKLRFLGASIHVANLALGDGFRAVGSYFTNPMAEGLSGTIAMGGDPNQYDGNVMVFGNELTGLAQSTNFVPDKMYHAIYLSGKRQGGTTHAPSMRNIEVAWNYLHDNSTNRAINIYSEQDGCSFIEEVRIHDNLIVNQRGDGILLGKAISGTANYIYNNVIINAGLGPLWRGNEVSSNAGIRISAGWPGLPASATRVGVYNNTIYGGGFASNSTSAALYWDPGDAGGSWQMTLDFANNVVSITDVPYWWGNAPVATSVPNLWSGRSGKPSWNTVGGIAADPMFAGAPANLRLNAGSPAIDVGVTGTSGATDVSAIVTIDADGASRPQNGVFDLGAYEYH